MAKTFEEWLESQPDKIKNAPIAFQHSQYAWDNSPLRNCKPCEVIGPIQIKVKDFEHYEWWRIFYRRNYYRTY